MTKEQVQKKYKNKYVSVSKTFDYETSEYRYTVHKAYSNIRENTTLGQDVGTTLEYRR